MRYYKRELYLKKIRPFYHDTEMIKVLTGIRRCGKSTILEMIKGELIDEGVSKEQIIDINLDKRGFKSIKKADDLEKCIDSMTLSDGAHYLFIDEVQNVTDFEPVINAFREEGNYSIFITGSNSYLLSGDLITKLTGRYIEFEIQTLSFAEYQGMKAFYHISEASDNQAEFDEYIINGGFPYAVRIEDPSAKRVYVENVVDEIIKKDIKSKNRIRHISVFERVMRYIINNFGSTTNIKKIHEYFLNEENLSITEDTIARYVQILENARIISRCSRFDMKSKRSLSGEQKYYLADLSLYFCRNTDNRINYGPVLENIVYNYAKSMGYSVSVGRIGKLECDFIVRGSEMNYAYIQVAYTILSSRETEDREYRPLELIRDNYPKYVMTEDRLIQKRNGIIHVNIEDFIKGGNAF